MTTSRPKLLLVDASNAFFRGFAAAPDLTAPNGFPTGGLHAFFQIIQSLQAKIQPDHLLLVFDKGKSFRSETFPEYKAHRKPKAQSFRVQWDAVLPICKAAGYPYYRKDDGYEADDVIGTLAERYKESVDVYIFSNDKDFAQLVDEQVFLLQPDSKGGLNLQGVEYVQKEYGGPNFVTTFLALVGDKADNVPGVPGIGGSFALKYIKDHGDWTQIYANIDKISGKKRESLIESKEIVEQAIELVTIVRDMPLDIDTELSINNMVKQPHNNDALYALAVEYGLKVLQKQFALKPPHEPVISDKREVRTVAEFETHRSCLLDAPQITIHPIFSSSDVHTRTLLGIGFQPFDSVGNPKDVLLSISFQHAELNEFSDLPLFETIEPEVGYNQELLDAVWEWMNKQSVTWVGHDFKQLMSFAKSNVKPLIWDSSSFVDIMLLDYLDHRFINHRDHSLPDIAQRLGLFEIVLDSEVQDEPFIWNALEAACCSISTVLSKFSLSDSMKQVLRSIENPCVSVLADMEVAGIRVNVEHFSEFAREIEARLQEILDQISAETGVETNLNSPKQVSTLLYETRGLKPSKKTKSGGSTDSKSLQLLMEQTDDPIIPLILEYREIGKIKSTYLDALPGFVREDGRIHTMLHQTVTATGRLSSSNPNMQNIPARKAWGKVIRKCFIATEGKVLISADYSQIEMRILAHLCGEGSLVDAFQSGEDVHLRTAMEISPEGSIAEGLANGQLRSIAKAINYGLIYGMSAYRLARELHLSNEDAQSYMTRYFERYPEVQNVLQKLIEDARETGLGKTLYGRERPIVNLDSIDKVQREGAERIALNAPIQGAAADIMKLAMVRVAERLQKEHPEATLLLQVHDELLVECLPENAKEISDMLVETMSNVVTLKVPLAVNVSTGTSWGDIH